MNKEIEASQEAKVEQEVKIEEVGNTAPIVGLEHLVPPQIIEQEPSDPEEEVIPIKSDAEKEKEIKLEEKPKKSSDLPPKVQKRIDAIRAQKGEVDRENEVLLSRLSEQDKRIKELETKKPTDKTYSNEELMGAIKTAGEEGNWDVVAKAMAKMQDNAIKTYQESEESKSESKTQVETQNKNILNALTSDFPEVSDPNSSLRKTANSIYEASKELQSLGYYGMYRATAQANAILAEEGMIGPSKNNKKQSKNDLSGGGAPPSNLPLATSEEDELDKYVTQRNTLV